LIVLGLLAQPTMVNNTNEQINNVLFIQLLHNYIYS
jgi:hypothetical protein